MLKMYGITNCNTVKKARVWLQEHSLPYEFHDYKKHGVPDDVLDQAIKQLGWEALVNKKGTTWRKLTPEQQAGVVDALSAKTLMLEMPSVIKRPLVFKGKKAVALGFNEDEWQGVFL